MSLVNSKSMVAKLLATENISVEVQNVRTASFDLKNRTLIVPNWENVSDSGYDLLLGHEVGHALDTPFDGWSEAITKKPALKQFLNVVEDSRIEKRIKRRYPGLRKSFFTGYSEFFKKDVFGIKDRNINDLFFVDRLNIHCKVGSLVSIDFNDEELSLVKLVESAESFEDVIAAAQAVYDYSKLEQEKEKEEDAGDDESESESESGDDESESESGESESESGESESGESKSVESESKSESESGEEDSDDDFYGDLHKQINRDVQQENLKEKHATYHDIGSSDGAFEPSCETNEYFEQSRENLSTVIDKSFLYVKYPTPILENIVTPINRVHELLKSNFNSIPEYVANKVLDFKNRNSRYIDLLAKEFEMRKAAKSYAKTKISNTGDIDVSKIYKYRTDDNVFLRSNITPKGKNHGMVILLDRSGSMSDNMKNSMEQLVVMAQFCKRVGVPFVVYGFGSNVAGACIDKNTDLNSISPHKSFTRGAREIHMSRVYLREYLNSNMRTTEFTEACNNIIALASLYGINEYSNSSTIQIPVQEQLSSTPLNEALLALAPISKEFKNKNNLEIVSTVIIQDGDADTFHNKYYGADCQWQYFQQYQDIMIINEKINGKVFQKKIAGLGIGYEQFNNAILDYYQEYTNTKVVGIFLMNKRQTKNKLMYLFSSLNINYVDQIDMRSVLKKDRFISINQPGYNKFFYVIGGSSMADIDEIQINSGMPVNKIKNAFLENNQKKLTNRLLVTQLVAEISAG